MAPRFLSLHPQTYQKLQRLKRQAEVGGEYRLARRLPAVLLHHDGHPSSAIAGLRQAPRSCMPWPRAARPPWRRWRTGT